MFENSIYMKTQVTSLHQICKLFLKYLYKNTWKFTSLRFRPLAHICLSTAHQISKTAYLKTQVTVLLQSCKLFLKYLFKNTWKFKSLRFPPLAHNCPLTQKFENSIRSEDTSNSFTSNFVNCLYNIYLKIPGNSQVLDFVR